MCRRRGLATGLILLLVAGLIGAVPATTRAASPGSMGPGSLGTVEARQKPRPAPRPPAAPPRTRVLQLNLCLSGLAPCFPRTGYRRVLREAVYHVRDLLPDAVMINEACTKDAERIAELTGMHLSFSRVMWGGKRPLACFDGERNPVSRQRGYFGNALLTRQAPVGGRYDVPYRTQDWGNADRRRVLCARTTTFDFCTTHLSTRGTAVGRRVNDAQCSLFARVVARRAATAHVVAGGDVNRRPACLPGRGWSVATDAGARQRPGIQHVYADPRLGKRVKVRVVPMAHTDHDALLMTIRP